MRVGFGEPYFFRTLKIKHLLLSVAEVQHLGGEPVELGPDLLQLVGEGLHGLGQLAAGLQVLEGQLHGVGALELKQVQYLFGLLYFMDKRKRG